MSGPQDGTLTIEDELALIKANTAPDPVTGGASGTWEEVAPETVPEPVPEQVPEPAPEPVDAPAEAPAVAPAEAPAARTPEDIDRELGLPPVARDLAPLPERDGTTWDVLASAWRAETIKTNAWGDKGSRRRALVADMWAMLGPEGQKAIEATKAAQAKRGLGGWSQFEEWVTAEAARQASLSPEAAAAWSGFPLSIEAFDQQILADRLADLEEAQAILDQPGGGTAEFIGAGARAMTDETSLMLLPFGGSGSLWRMMAKEALLGAAGEAAVLPKEYRVAGELGLADPDPVTRIATGAALGGGLAGLAHLLGRGVTALHARTEAHRASLAETIPEGMDRIDHEAKVEAAEAKLRDEETPKERLAGLEGGARAETPPKAELGAVLAEPAPGGLPPVGPGAPPNWERIRNGIFVGESGGDFNALFGYQNRKGGKFANIKLTDMTVDQAIAFSDPKGPYGQWVKAQIGRVATPMGAYQIVGSTLRGMKKKLGLKGDEVMTPEFQEYLGQQIYLEQGTGAWEGYKGPRDSYTPGTVDGPAPKVGPTKRGYTGDGQVSAGDGFRIDVEWEVVDAASLLRASGDLQPRDRSRIASDAWIADTAARLDPAQLMPSPTADRGSPIVGPDNVIESGNGRFGAIERAYARHPDRAEAYRGAIEAAGFAIPEGVERPVLIARRKTDLSPEDRSRFAIEAQDSGVAVMTPTEMARASGRAMTAPVLSRLDPGLPLRADGNGDFVRAALQGLPRSQRNAMFGADGMLNAAGERQLREAIFARAWPDPDILARFTETDAGELKSLMEALDRSAPSWAALKADIEAGLVTPEMDISGFVLDAMRLIGAARDLSRREGLGIARAVQEMLDEVDLIEGAISPLTAALVRKFWQNGRAAKADDVAAFLTRYADDARKAGASGSLFDAPTPRDILRAIDPETFADLPEDMGAARGFARPGQEAPPEAVADQIGDGFDQGAASPEAEAVGATIEAELRTPPAKKALGSPREAFASALSAPAGISTMAEILTKADKKWLRDAYDAGLLEKRPTGLGSNTAYRYLVQDSDATWQRAEIQPSPKGATDPDIAAARTDLDEFADPANAALDPPLTTQDLRPVQTAPSPADAFEQLLASRQQPPTSSAAARLQKMPAGFGKSIIARFTPRDSGARFTPPVSAAREPRATDGARAAPPPFSRDGQGPVDDIAEMSVEDTFTTRTDLGEFAEVEIDLPDGTRARAGDLLDDLDADTAADAVLQACGIAPGGAQ